MVIFATVGAFTVNNNLFDVWTMLDFGILGYIMAKLKYPIVPLVLAMVLGRLADRSRCQARTVSGENQTNFFTRSIALLVFSAAILAHFRPANR